MTVAYFAVLAVLTFAAYAVAVRRSSAIAVSGPIRLHSLPAYHGLLAASVVLVPMLMIYLFGSQLVSTLATSNALSQFPADVQSDALKSGSALRDIRNLATGTHSGDASPVLTSAAAAYSSLV